MNRTRTAAPLALLLSLLLTLAGGATQAAGFTSISAPDPEGDALEVGIWYPSTTEAAPLAMGPITQTVALNAPIAGQALPLVLVSHGTGGSLLSHHDTAIALADAGFIVAAVEHTGDNYRDQSRALQIRDRARQVSRVIDHLLTNWDGHAHIDALRIGMFGFSAGGFTALVDIGGKPDLTRIAPYCKDHPSDYACVLIAAHPEFKVGADTDRKDMRDRRIRSAVVAAPALGYTFAPDGLHDVTVPVALWRAEHDIIVPDPWYTEAVRLALAQAPEYHLVPKAGHFDFLAPCSAQLAAIAPPICASAKDFDRSAFHAEFNAAVVTFFSRTLEN